MSFAGRLFVLVMAACAPMSYPATAAMAAEERLATSRWALLIGVDTYLDTRLGKLNYCGADVQALRDLLVRKAGFPEDQVLVLHDKQDNPLRRPLRMAIQRTLEAFLAQPKAGDLVLIAFSGHGTSVGPTSYLCPADADLDQPQATMLSVLALYDKLQTGCKAAQKIMVVDACRKNPKSGPRAPGDVMSRSLADSLRQVPEGLLVLSSCKAGQLSYEDETVDHGVFMHYILEGLSGKADRRGSGLPGNGDGVVDVDELFNFAAVETGRFVLKQFTETQTPEMFGTKIGGRIEVSCGLDPRNLLAKARDAAQGIDRPQRYSVLAEIAALYAKAGDRPSASSIFAEATGGEAHDSLSIAQSMLRAGDAQGARKLLEERLARLEDGSPDFTATVLAAAPVQAGLGDLSGVERTSQRLGREPDSDFRDHGLLAVVRLQANHGLFEGALRTSALIRDDFARISSLLLLASAEQRAGEASRAKNTLMQANELAEKLHALLELDDNRDPGEAKARWDRLRKRLGPEEVQARVWFTLAEVQSRLHDFERATDSAEQIGIDTASGCGAPDKLPFDLASTEKRFDRVCAFLCMARGYARLARDEAARAMFQKAISIALATKAGSHYRTNALGRVALLQAEVGLTVDAYRTFTKACEEKKNDEGDPMRQGWFGCFMSSGNPAKLAKLLTQQGSLEEALHTLEMTRDAQERAYIYIGIARGVLIARGSVDPDDVEDDAY